MRRHGMTQQLNFASSKLDERIFFTERERERERESTTPRAWPIFCNTNSDARSVYLLAVANLLVPMATGVAVITVPPVIGQYYC